MTSAFFHIQKLNTLQIGKSEMVIKTVCDNSKNLPEN